MSEDFVKILVNSELFSLCNSVLLILKFNLNLHFKPKLNLQHPEMFYFLPTSSL